MCIQKEKFSNPALLDIILYNFINNYLKIAREKNLDTSQLNLYLHFYCRSFIQMAEIFCCTNFLRVSLMRERDSIFSASPREEERRTSSSQKPGGPPPDYRYTVLHYSILKETVSRVLLFFMILIHQSSVGPFSYAEVFSYMASISRRYSNKIKVSHHFYTEFF